MYAVRFTVSRGPNHVAQNTRWRGVLGRDPIAPLPFRALTRRGRGGHAPGNVPLGQPEPSMPISPRRICR
eukprot:988551-Prymnesium_polylepis.1